MNRYAFALRMARQDALRAKGRTALVLAMIGLPIGAVVTLAVLQATVDANVEGEPGSATGAESAILAMLFAMVLLEVVLLAGPAFLMDVRRRRRELALVASSGGAGRHLRAVVLASGLLLGGIAAVAGAGLGIAAAAVIVRASSGSGFGPFSVPWIAVAATMLVGAGSGLFAALVPAWQAGRMDVVAALAGRREPAAAARRGWPIAGGVLVLAGVAASLEGIRVLREFGAALGAAAIIIGLVLACPWIVETTGRLAPRLPLPLRLAVRDGARNRARTAPAVAAIMAAVAGVTALAIGGASDYRQRQVEYQARLPHGSALIRLPQGGNEAAAAAAVQRALPGVPVVPLRTLPGEGAPCLSEDTSKCLALSFTAEQAGEPSVQMMEALVGGAREARLLLGRDDPAVSSALAAGKIVMFRVRPLPGGTATATVTYWKDDRQHTSATIKDLPAVTAQGDPHVRAIVPPKAAEELAAKAGVPIGTEAVGVDRADHRVTKAEEARLKRTMAAFSPDDDPVHVERGFTESFGGTTLLLGALAAVLAIGATLIATGLAAADARPDLATLRAVGARPRTGRLLTMGRGAYIAALGCWLGIAGGLVPGLAVARPLTDTVDEVGAAPHGTIIDVPWLLLLAIGIGIPLVAACAAGAVTGGRLTLTRREAG
ncbi:FtsX-like permease family protein [Actinomadura sp. WMMA1423]|uniref:FtsX-like permease family protein n=1 Tax=Actinomadura sp. WMMA1423 TaxID=2591108 RepID=UPI0011476BEF|nr:FtsX-like permease family protein [Actinomadura sp. WMMA1423]